MVLADIQSAVNSLLSALGRKMLCYVLVTAMIS